MGASQIDATGRWLRAEWPVDPGVLATANANMAAATALPISSEDEGL